MRFGMLVVLLFSLVLAGCFGTSGISLSKGNTILLHRRALTVQCVISGKAIPREWL